MPIDPHLTAYTTHEPHPPSRITISARDVLAWVKFIAVTSFLPPMLSFYHGAHTVFVDALGCGDKVLAGNCKLLREFCENVLHDLSNHGDTVVANDMQAEDKFGIPPFFIE